MLLVQFPNNGSQATGPKKTDPKKRTERDSNPRYAQGAHSISSAAPSAARSPVQ